MPDLYTVTRSDTETTFNDRGDPVEKIRVWFKVGEEGPFRLLFDKATFNGFQTKAEIEKFAREILTVKGQ